MAKPDTELFFNISTSLFKNLEDNLTIPVIVNRNLDNMTENVYLLVRTDENAREDIIWHYDQISMEFYCNNNANFIYELAKLRNVKDKTAIKVYDYYNNQSTTEIGTVVMEDLNVLPLSSIESYQRRTIQYKYKFISSN